MSIKRSLAAILSAALILTAPGILPYQACAEIVGSHAAGGPLGQHLGLFLAEPDPHVALTKLGHVANGQPSQDPRLELERKSAIAFYQLLARPAALQDKRADLVRDLGPEAVGRIEELSRTLATLAATSVELQALLAGAPEGDGAETAASLRQLWDGLKAQEGAPEAASVVAPAAATTPARPALSFDDVTARKVSKLRTLLQGDREAAFAMASGIINDPAETRYGVRVSALEALDSFEPERRLPLYLAALQHDADGFLRREAARRLGRDAARAGARKDEYVQALRDAQDKDAEYSVRLMAQSAVRQFGVDAGPDLQLEVPRNPLAGLRIDPVMAKRLATAQRALSFVRTASLVAALGLYLTHHLYSAIAVMGAQFVLVLAFLVYRSRVLAPMIAEVKGRLGSKPPAVDPRDKARWRRLVVGAVLSVIVGSVLVLMRYFWAAAAVAVVTAVLAHKAGVVARRLNAPGQKKSANKLAIALLLVLLAIPPLLHIAGRQQAAPPQGPVATAGSKTGAPAAKPAEAPKPDPDAVAPKEPNETEVQFQQRKDLHEFGREFKQYHKDWVQANARGPWWQSLLSWLPIIAIWGFVMFNMRRAMKNGGLGNFLALGQKAERPKTRFKDVAGIDETIIDLKDVVDSLNNYRKFGRLGGKAPKGVLLVGPPGGGKTLSARAVAGEANVPFFSVSGSDFVKLFVGGGTIRVKDLFSNAKANAPCIIFIDELDAIGRQRDGLTGGGNDERLQTLNELLVQMDGFDNDSGVIVMAATNRPEVLDEALTRPGRFDRRVTVNRPDLLGREAILAIHGKGKILGPDVDLKFLSKRLSGRTGAFLESVINEGTLLAERRGLPWVGMAELHEAVDRVNIGGARATIRPDEIRKRIAYHEAGHVLAGKRAGEKTPNKVTIIAHGDAGGFAEPVHDEEDAESTLMTPSRLKRHLVGIMGGRAAEEVALGEMSTGFSNDREQADHVAGLMVELGMTDLGMLARHRNPQNQFLRPEAEGTAAQIDQKAKELKEEALKEARRLLSDPSDRLVLDKLAAALLQQETIYKDEIDAIVGVAAPAGPAPAK